MISQREEHRLTFAESALTILHDTALGVQILYLNRDEDEVEVWALPEGESLDKISQQNREDERRTRVFQIPYQTGFPPDGRISEGDRIIWETDYYRVLRWTADSLGAVYTLETVFDESVRAGTGI